MDFFNNEVFNQKAKLLVDAGVPIEFIYIPLTGAFYFEKLGGIETSKYWNNAQLNHWDELMIILSTHFFISKVMEDIDPIHDWRGEFDVAFLFQLKHNSQSIVSINALLNNNCYFDIFNILRSMQSRLHLLLLCSLNPRLFDLWLKEPNNSIFREGRIRAELDKHNINTLEHLYKFGSEIVHGHYLGLHDTGFMVKGLFPYISSVEDQIIVITKFFVGIAAFTALYMLKLDKDLKNLPKEIVEIDNFLEYILKNILVYNRIDHIFASVCQERHCKKISDNKYLISEGFDFIRYFEILQSFYGFKETSKKLSPQYNI